MKESIEEFLRGKTREKESGYYMLLIQKIKIFIDTSLTDMSCKNDEDRMQGYFNSLMRIRDLTQAEISEYTFTQNLNKMLDDFEKKKKVEDKDWETFKELSEDSRGIRSRNSVGERPINYHKMREQVESTTDG